MEMWLRQVWKAETIQTPYTEFDRCLLYCQLFNKAPLCKAPLWLVHRNVEAYHASTSLTVHPSASVVLFGRVVGESKESCQNQISGQSVIGENTGKEIQMNAIQALLYRRVESEYNRI